MQEYSDIKKFKDILLKILNWFHASRNSRRYICRHCNLSDLPSFESSRQAEHSSTCFRRPNYSSMQDPP